MPTTSHLTHHQPRWTARPRGLRRRQSREIRGHPSRQLQPCRTSEGWRFTRVSLEIRYLSGEPLLN